MNIEILLVPVAVLCVALGVVFALTVNRRANIGQTVVCFMFPVLFASFAWTAWDEWHKSGGIDINHVIAFVCACLTCAVTLVALGRRIWWLRHNHHTP